MLPVLFNFTLQQQNNFYYVFGFSFLGHQAWASLKERNNKLNSAKHNLTLNAFTIVLTFKNRASYI